MTKTAGTPAGVPDPTGNVTFNLLLDRSTAPARRGPSERSRSRRWHRDVERLSPLAAGNYCRTRRIYNGDANYPARDGGI